MASSAQAAVPVGKIKAILGKAIPGIRFTSATRTQAEQDDLVASGATKARNSQHVSGTGLDVVLPEGVATDAVRHILIANDIDPTEYLNETGKGAGQGTGPHLHIGWGDKAAAPKQSTFDRVKAKRAEAQTQAGPSIAKVYEAYKTGQMTPDEARDFVTDVNSGAVILPRGASIGVKPTAATLPKGVVEAYNSHSDMTDEERAQVDADIAAGLVKPPSPLRRPAARTAGESFGMGSRSILEGAGGLVDIVGAPLNATVNAVTGTNLSTTPGRDLGAGVSDALNLATAQTPSEKLIGAITEGATQGMLTAGVGGLASGARGATGIVARELAANPATDIIASGVGTGAAEKARQEGVGPVGQLAVGVLAGGGAGFATKAAERVAARFGPKVAQAVKTIPREALFDEKGAPTDEGHEIAAQRGVKPDDLKAAYDDHEAASKPPPEVAADDTNGLEFHSTSVKQPGGADVVKPEVQLEAAGINGATITGHDPAFGPVIEGLDWPTARRALEVLGDGDAKGVLSHPDVDGPIDVIWGNEKGGLAHILDRHPEIGDDFPALLADMRVKSASPNRVRLESDAAEASIRLDYDGTRKTWLVTAYEKGRPPRKTSSGSEGLGERADDLARPANLNIADGGEVPKGGAARAEEAASEGVSLTKGQATKDFGAQEQEQALAATASPEGQKVRDHFDTQAEQIKTAVQRFKEGFGDTSLGATERGQILKDALRDLRDNGKAGVAAFYKQAEDMAESLGEAGSNLIKLDTDPILARIKNVLIDEGVAPEVRSALRQQAAQYGLIGGKPRLFEDGTAAVRVRDIEGNEGPSITLAKPPQPLTVVNAEDFRQFVNSQYQKDTTGALQSLKSLIDDAVAGAVERATKAPGDVGGAFKAARAANVEQAKTFKSGDVVQKLIDWKKGQTNRTEAVLPEAAIKTVFAGGPEGLTNLRKIKAVLLSKPTEASANAWKAIQAHGVADIFKQALSANDSVSGLKLNTAIKKFGPDKLKVLLPEEDFNQLMKLRRIIGDATIPLPRTTNPSGSGYAVMRFLSKQASALGPVAKAVPLLRDVVQGAEEFVAKKATAETAKGVTDFTPEAAAALDAKAGAPKKDPIAWARKFLDLASSDQIIAPLMAAAANEDRP